MQGTTNTPAALFLRGSAAALAVAGLAEKGTLRAAAAEPAAGQAKRRWRLSSSSVPFSALSLDPACARIAALKFEAVDFWHESFNCPHLQEIERLGADWLRETLAKHSLKLCAFTCYGVKGNKGYPRYAELLGQAGGGLAIRESRYGKFGNPAQDMKAFFETMKPLAELAEKYQSRIAIENHGKALLNSADSFKAFVDLNPFPHVGVAIAPYHLQAAGISVEEVIRLAGKQVFFFYAWQHAAGLQQLPGVGPADVTPWMKALADIGYAGDVNPFLHGEFGLKELGEVEKGLAVSRSEVLRCGGFSA